MLKAYKYRIYPNNEQKIQSAKTFGCCRFVYNQTLVYRKEVYEKEKKPVIIEIKIADGTRSLQKAAEKAKDQINDMRYADGISAQGYQKVIKYGAAFYQKNCLISKSEV